MKPSCPPSRRRTRNKSLCCGNNFPFLVRLHSACAAPLSPFFLPSPLLDFLDLLQYPLVLDVKALWDLQRFYRREIRLWPAHAGFVQPREHAQRVGPFVRHLQKARRYIQILARGAEILAFAIWRKSFGILAMRTRLPVEPLARYRPEFFLSSSLAPTRACMISLSSKSIW